MIHVSLLTHTSIPHILLHPFTSNISGDWEKARDIFHETVSLPGGKQDGPSQRLIQVIDEHGGSSPSNWPGYRMDDGGH